MSTTMRLGLASGYPSKIPKHQADIYLESGASGLRPYTADGNNIFYDFKHEVWVQQSSPTQSLHRSSSSNALSIYASHNTSLTPVKLPIRSSTPQPQKPLKELQIDITQDMRDEAQVFAALVSKYNTAVSDPQDQLDFTRCKNFDDLKGELERLQLFYKNAHSTKSPFMIRLRQCIRNTSKASESVNSWLRLLPGDSKELSFLVGGISIVFDASARLDDLREETYDILVKIPNYLRRAFKYRQYYQDAKELTRFVSDLYVAVLRALGGIMELYAESPTRKAFKAIFKGDAYGKALQKSLRTLEDSAQEVLREAELARHGADHLFQDESRFKQNQIFQGMQRVCRGQEEMVQYMMEEMKRKRILEQQLRRDHEQQQLENKRFVLNTIQYRHHETLGDHRAVFHDSLTLEKPRQNFAASMLQTEEFKRWLLTRKSSVLAINANDEDDMVSPVSMASVLLLSLLENRHADIMTISWFCGLHTYKTAIYDMLVSMIGQLCQSPAFDVDLQQDTQSEMLEELSMHSKDIEYLTKLFGVLLKRQLQRSAIYIIIDGASFYETNAMYERARQLFALLTDLTKVRVNNGQPLKVLLTSPQRCMYFTKGFGREHVLDMEPLEMLDEGEYADEFDDF